MKTSQTISPHIKPLANALKKSVYSGDGRLIQTGNMLPGNRGTGTAKEAKVNNRKKARNTGPPRNRFHLSYAFSFFTRLDHAL